MPEDAAPSLTHDTIGDLEQGAIGHVINLTLAALMADCRARPALKKSRKFTLTIDLEPSTNDGIEQGVIKLAGVAVKASVKHTLPPQAGGVEILGVRDGVNFNGEPITEAVFTMQPLLRIGSN